MIAVVSANGKLTNGRDPDIYKWTSHEDHDFFAGEVRKAKLIVMGSGTYEAVRGKIKHSPKKLRIVLTSFPEKYKDQQIHGQLEFKNTSLEETVNALMHYHSEMLLVGGSQIYSSFAKAGLIDEIYLTIEPVVFGKGKPLFADWRFESKLKLESVEKLNKRGTLLLKYSIKHESRSSKNP